MRTQMNVRRRKRREVMTVMIWMCFDNESTQDGIDRL
jgi:hypothetical protein